MNIRLWKILICSVFLIKIAYTQIAQPSKHSHRKADEGTILFLFQNKIYPSLNTKLLEYQTAFEQDNQEENNVYEAFNTFSSAVALYEVIFNNWVQKYANIYQPYVGRAKYYIACAWTARGHNWANETTEDQFQEMRRFLSLSLEDIKCALTLNPKLDVCYDMMIEIGMTVSDDRLKKNALSEALKYNPYGFHVRSKYLHTFTPRWGGSYQEMEDFCDEAKKYSAYNPELKSLRSQIFSDKAKVFESEQNNEEAVQYYSKALKYREFADYYAERGDCYYALEKYKLALNDYNKALDLKPNSPEYMRRKSGVLFRLNKLSDAQDLIEEASRLDPNNKWIQKKKDFYESDGVKAYKHSKQGLEYFQANRFQDAIRLNGDLSINYFSRGSCYIQLKRYDEALKDYKEVLVHQRDNLKAYDAIGWIQYHTGSIMMPSLLLILS